LDAEIALEDIRKTLFHQKNSKASGPDGISSEMIKSLKVMNKGRLFVYAFKCLLTVLSVMTSLYYKCITIVISYVLCRNY